MFQTQTVEQKDIEVSDPPGDSTSCLAFSPVLSETGEELLAVGSWDNYVRIYKIDPSGKSAAAGFHVFQAPVLDMCWSKDGRSVISCGADNMASKYDLVANTTIQVAKHDAPIKCVRWADRDQNILATGSWDRTLKYWDQRQPTPILSMQLPERCYSMDVVFPLMVVGTAERHICIYNMERPSVEYKSLQSPLKWQTRVVSCFPSADGYAIGSIEGRVAIQYVEENKSSNNFSFKCHRKDQAPNVKDQTLVYSVNDIKFHPVHGTFSTAGSDGTVNFWDKDARTRLKTFEQAPGPITSSAFNRNGSIFSYAVSYDWSKGYTGMTPGFPNKLMLHACKEDEVKKRPAKR